MSTKTGLKDEWFVTRAELDEFLAKQEEQSRPKN